MDSGQKKHAIMALNTISGIIVFHKMPYFKVLFKHYILC